MLLTDSRPQQFDNWATFLGGGRVAGVPMQFIWLILLTIIVWIFATKTRLGRDIHAMGDSLRAAQFAGINTDRLTVCVYALSGTLAGFGGLLIVGLLNNAKPNLGTGYELDVIAAAILGGVALTGGRGAILGVVAGAALMGLLRNGFVLSSVSAHWQTIVIGLVVLVAVGADSFRRRKGQPGGAGCQARIRDLLEEDMTKPTHVRRQLLAATVASLVLPAFGSPAFAQEVPLSATAQAFGATVQAMCTSPEPIRIAALHSRAWPSGMLFMKASTKPLPIWSL